MGGALVILATTAAITVLIASGGRASRVAWWLGPTVLPVVGLIVIVTIVGRALRRRRFRPVDVVSLTAAILAIVPVTWLPIDYPFAYPASADRVRPSLAVRLPLAGAVRVMWGGNTKSENYHAVYPDQRWAYDLTLEPAPDALQEPPPSLDSYGCWEKPVMAPIEGRIYSMSDGEADHRPGTRGPGQGIAGNYVDLEVTSTGTHLLIAHLRQGSVRVAVGDEIVEGDTLGLCGNSGNALGPHVHLHHQREPWVPVAPWRLAEGLPLFFRDYEGDENPHGGATTDGNGRVVWRGSVLENDYR